MSAGLDIHQIQEIRQEIELIKTLLADLDPKMTKMHAMSMREIALMTTALNLSRRMGLPEDMERAIGDSQRLISMLMQLRAAYLAVLAARMAAGDPLAWGTAALAMGGAVVTVSDYFGSYG